MLSNELVLTYNANTMIFKVDCDTSYDDVYYLQYCKKGFDLWFSLKITTKPTISYEMHPGLNAGDCFRIVSIRNAAIRFTSTTVVMESAPSELDFNAFIPDNFVYIMSQYKEEKSGLSLRAYFIDNTVAFKVDCSFDGIHSYNLQYRPKSSDKWYNVCEFDENLYRYHLPYFSQVGDMYRVVIHEGKSTISKSNEVRILKPYTPEIDLVGIRNRNTLNFKINGSDLENCYLQYRRSGSSAWTDLHLVETEDFSYQIPDTTRIGDGYRCVVKEGKLVTKVTNEIHIREPYLAD